jgi:hypothetical protein
VRDRKIKKPKAEGSRRIAHPAEAESTQDMSPVFCLRYLAEGYGLRDCDDSEAKHFAAKLVALCQLDWDSIAKAPREGMGNEKMPKNQIVVPLPPRVTEDVTHLHVFRFSGTGIPHSGLAKGPRVRGLLHRSKGRIVQALIALLWPERPASSHRGSSEARTIQLLQPLRVHHA